MIGIISGFASFDGVLGLGINSESYYWDTPMSNLYRMKTISEPQFAFYFSDDDSDSELYIGGYNPKHTNGSINWFSLYKPMSAIYFEITIDSIMIGGNIVDSNVNALLHSVTTSITCPPDVLPTVMNQIGAKNNGSGYYFVNCSKPAPSLSFKINGITYELSPSDYILNISSLCYVSIQPLSWTGQDFRACWVLGQAFMKKVYTIFDLNGKIGMVYAAVSSN